MKKILILGALLSSMAFADNNANKFLEKRIEDKITMEKIVEAKGYEVDYDVDVYNDKMNLEIELEGLKKPSLNYEEISKKVIESVSQATSDIKEIYISIKFDPTIGEDELLYSNLFKMGS